MLDQKHNLAQLAGPGGLLLVETTKNTLQLSRQQVSCRSASPATSFACAGSIITTTLQMPRRCKPFMI